MAAGSSKLVTAAPAILIFGLIGGATYAQVTTDGTVGPRVRLDGPEFEIGADLGTRAGRNLFHSFERFSLATAERATFSGPGGIRNVISRVTGGERSEIDGTIRSTIPGADFYFLNPAGVMFGPNASLDVKGSFHVSTADELRFTDRFRFSAGNRAASSFTVAHPEAFGFLDAQPENIEVKESILRVPSGEALSLVGGDINIVGGPLGFIRAEAGTITLAAVASAASLDIASGKLSADQRANITLADQALVDVSGDGGGRVRIRGGNFVVDGESFIFADNLGATHSGGGIDVAADSVNVLAGSALTADTFGSGEGGKVAVAAKQIVLSDGGSITSVTTGQGAGGNVILRAGEALSLSNRGVISTEAFDQGAAGDVAIYAASLRVDNSFIGANSRRDATESGDAGAITVHADRIEFINEGRIFNGSDGMGDGGEIDVTARTIIADATVDHLADFHTGISASANAGSSGSGGDITVTANQITLINGAEITSITRGEGDGGNVVIVARKALDLSNDGFIGGSSAEGDTIEIGDAGTVTIHAGRIEFVNDGRIFNGTDTAGDGGDIKVEAKTIFADVGSDPTGNHTGISASANRGSSGLGGDVTVIANQITLINDAEITSDTQGKGAGGNVLVYARETLNLDGGFIGTSSREGATETGDAGTVTVHAGRIEFVNDGRIFNGTDSAGDGGDIKVMAGTIFADVGSNPTINHTGISASANPMSSGNGGDVMVKADRIRLINGAEISSDTDSSGAAGTVKVSAKQIELHDGGQIFTTSSATGDAGSITVSADRLEMDAGRITTDTASAGGGEVQLVVNDVVDLRNSAVTTSVAGGDSSTAGNILIDPMVLIIDGSRVQANAPAGFGGRVTIVADNILVPGGDFDALLARGDISATGGDPTRAGSVVVSAPEVDLAGGLVVLEGALLDAASQLRERCGARRDIGASSFTGVGRGGLPASPDAPLASGYSDADGRVGETPVAAASGRVDEAAWPSSVRLVGLAPCRSWD